MLSTTACVVSGVAIAECLEGFHPLHCVKLVRLVALTLLPALQAFCPDLDNCCGMKCYPMRMLMKDLIVQFSNIPFMRSPVLCSCQEALMNAVSVGNMLHLGECTSHCSMPGNLKQEPASFT